MSSFPPLAEREPPFSVSQASSAQLGDSLERALKSHASSMQRLRLAVDACVGDLHRIGMAPETVLATMKALLRHTATAHPPLGLEPSRYAAETFMEDVVRWAIVAYFRLEYPAPETWPSAGQPSDGRA
jgi:hypothetical protein